MKYLTQGCIQLIITQTTLYAQVTVSHKLFHQNNALLLPLEVSDPVVYLPCQDKALLNYDIDKSFNFLKENVTILAKVAGNTLVDIILEKELDTFTIIGLNVPASVLYVDENGTFSLKELPGFNYDGNGPYRWNWTLGYFHSANEIIDKFTY